MGNDHTYRHGFRVRFLLWPKWRLVDAKKDHKVR